MVLPYEQIAVPGAGNVMDPLAQIDAMLGRPKKQKKQPTDVMPPEQQDTALAMLGRGALSGAAAVGGFLDKYMGSRALRGWVGGKPEELLSIIPFSDKLGITNPDNIVHPKDITGWDDPNSWWDDIGNFGVAVALDPTLPLTGFLKGGLTAAGKAAKSASVLKDLDWAIEGTKGFAGKLTGRAGTTLEQGLKSIAEPTAQAAARSRLAQQFGGTIPADILGQKIGKSLGVGVPFKEPFGAFNVPGLNKARDVAFNAIRKSPPVKILARYMNAPSKEMKSLLGQKIAQNVTAQEARDFEITEKILNDALRLTEEGKFTQKDAAELYKQLEGFRPVAAENAEMVGRLRKANAQTLKDDLALGLGAKLDDKYIKNYMARAGLESTAKQREVLDSVSELLASRGLDKSRSDPLRDVIGGTGRLMEILADADVIGAKRVLMASPTMSRKEQALSQIMTVLKSKFGADLPEHVSEPYFLEGLAEIIRRTPDEILSKGFYKNPLEAHLGYAMSHARRQRAANAQIDMMGRGVTAPGKDRVTLESLFEAQPIGGGKWGSRVGMRKFWRPDDVRNPMSGGAYTQYIKRYGTKKMKQDAEILEDMWNTGKQSGDAAAVEASEKLMVKMFDEVGGLTIPKDLADDIFRWDKKAAGAESINDLLKWWDSTTNMFKAGVLTAPPRYTRDAVSGQIQNALFRQFSIHGANAASRFMRTGEILNPKQYLKDIPTAKLAAMSEKEASRFLNARIRAMGFLSESRMSRSQVGATTSAIKDDTLTKMMDTMPSPKSYGLRNAAKELAEPDIKKWAPWNIRGVGFKADPRATTENPFFKAGNVIGDTTDAANRLVPFFELSRRGIDPAEVMRRIAETQVDYSGKAFTNFEKRFMGRAFPFHKFTKSMIPVVAKELIDSPAGRMAQVVRGGARLASGDDTFLPEHLRQTMAIPLGGKLGSRDPKLQRYLTGLGLMHEDALNLLRPGQTAYETVKGTIQEILGKSNPIAKGAIETGTGIQLYTGRELKTLDSPVGRMISNLGITKEPPRVSPLIDEAITNSMFSRLLSTTGQLTNKRKGPLAKATALLTGLKFTDIDKKKARNIAIRSEIDKRLLGKKGVRRLRPHLYVKKEDRGKLDPIDLMLMDMYRQQRIDSVRAAKAMPTK